MINYLQILGMAEQAVLEAGAAIMDIYRSGDIGLRTKEDASPVTKADKAAQDIILGRLERMGWPVLSEESAVMEFDRRRVSEYCWLVDPLDGTKEFVDKLEEFTVNIALVERSTPVAGVIYAPFHGVTWLGSKATGVWKKRRSGVRQLSPRPRRRTMDELKQMGRLTVVASRSHLSAGTMAFIRQFGETDIISMGSSLKFMALAEGKADLYPRLGTTMEWDTAAAHAILNACNRGVYQMDLTTELQYNKPDPKNPFFVAF